uniref:Uncharacterized protein n=1 Tax=Meloidogyne javanica TaxID=6303 RepID=A0A915MF06_MELJA
MPYKSDFPPVEIANEPYPPRLLSALWEHFSECPERIALINSKEPNTDFVTFGELYVFSLATAAFLQNRGFLFGDVACLVMQNCWEYVPIFAGIGLQGGATSGANPYFTQRELQYQFNESQAKIVFCSETCLDNVIGAVKGAQTVKTIVLVESGHSKKPLNQNENQLPFGVIRFGQVLRTEPTIAIEFSLVNCRPDKDIILLPFSSGTTGSPKGVIITHKNIGTMLNILIDHFRNQIHAYMRPPFIEKEENELLLLPFFHCYGFCMLQACLLNGSTGLVMAGFEPKLFCETIQNFKISGYGMTELTVASHFPVLDKQRYKSTGKLLSNLEMKIVEINSDDEVEVEKGMPGELLLRGPTIMLGYLRKPEETKRIINSDGWLRTVVKDIELFEGNIKGVGWIKVAPAELEDLLLSHPDIEDCAVVGISDPMSGELPFGFVVKKEGSSLSVKDVQEFVKSN